MESVHINTVKTKWLKSALLMGVGFSTLAFAQTSFAQDQSDDNDVVIATGIRQSLENALIEKRAATNIKEIIQAEDIGKLPDQNLAEVLENVTGIQITRSAGVGTAVQIRGTDANRTEINGVSTVGAGSGRSGISFEDLPASLIASVEVTKVPEAKTIEGSVGGTINLRTIRPLDLDEGDLLASFRAQAEHSDLADSVTPRFSGTLGKKWSNPRGQEIGLVLSGAYSQLDVAAFRPRVDRDGLVTPDSGRTSAEAFPFLRSQFFVQEQDAFNYETINLNGSFEAKVSDSFKIFVDGLYNDQERAQEGYRLQYSGVSSGDVVDNTTNTAFETVDLGSVRDVNGTVDLGTVEAVTAGILLPGGSNPNLRSSTDTGARVTESSVFRFGGEWEKDRWTARAEFAHSASDTVNPNFSTTLDFVNPNGTSPEDLNSVDNGTPVVFDHTGGSLTFGIAQGLDSTPTTAMLLDPANYQLRQVQQGNDMQENKETAARLDFSYDISDQIPFLTSIDAGYRYSDNSTLNDDSSANFNYTNTSSFNRPSGNLFAGLLVAGPDNYDDADGRDLFVADFLQLDPSISFSDPNFVRSTLNRAISSSNAARPDRPAVDLITSPTSESEAFFDISEKTHSLYAQANFSSDNLGIPVRGNAGVRWLSTDVESVGNTIINDVATSVVTKGSYDFFLPRFNLVLEPSEDLLVRAGVARDIRRPDFNDVATSITFGTSADDSVTVGNPNLAPESVWSYDLSGEYYFSPSSILSVGVFHKVRKGLFSEETTFPPTNTDATGQDNISIDPSCPGGGIFNPIANRNINNPIEGDGICVPERKFRNGEGNTTQTGVEVAFQYDLSGWEDKLGWASGFGFIGNYTYQEQGGSATKFASNFNELGVRRDIFAGLGLDGVSKQVALENLSKNAYNATIFYDKYGLSARARYTWRSSYDSSDDEFFGTFVVNGARGQLNASVNYDVTDNINVGIEGVNLTREDQTQYCINDKALLCFQGLTDRRVVAGVNFTF